MNEDVKRPLFSATNAQGKPVLGLWLSLDMESAWCIDESGKGGWCRSKDLTITNPVPVFNTTSREDASRKESVSKFSKRSK